MIRFHAVCKLCHRDFFKLEDIVSFALKDGKLHQVSLEGRDGPWAGIRCVCVRCAYSIAAMVIQDMGGKPQDAPGEAQTDQVG